MDQEPQPSVWPPAPQGMERTPSTNTTTFKAAPTQWAVGLVGLAALSELIRSLCNLGVTIAPKIAIFGAVYTIESKLSSDIVTIALVAFLVWFYRVYKNLFAFKTAGLRDTAGWAVGWFFVPVMSFYRPYQTAQTIWQASSPNIDSRNEHAWRREPPSRAIRPLA